MALPNLLKLRFTLVSLAHKKGNWPNALKYGHGITTIHNAICLRGMPVLHAKRILHTIRENSMLNNNEPWIYFMSYIINKVLKTSKRF